MKTCLIFGGSVFVGRSIAERLVQAGYRVYVLNRGNYPTPTGCIQITADRNDMNQITQVFEELSFDVVFDGSAYHPKQTAIATQCLLGKTKHFIHISSASVYLRTESFPVIFTEESPVGHNPNWGTYGYEKYQCEQLLRKAFLESGFPITIFRPFYIYGKGNNLNREKYIFHRLLKKESILVPRNGSTQIQFGHIDDLVHGLVACMLKEESYGEIYNIAGHEVVSFTEWIQICAEVVGVDPEIKLVKDKHGDHHPRQWFPFRDTHLVGNCAKLRAHLGITPRVRLLEGLQDTYESVKEELIEKPVVHTEAERRILTLMKRF
ncbi:NAD-dependent epimerase/dehydratase family protein [Marininema halotolerans]|uniref:dTDP-glucose 4,6-dehydratase n=1 Tax=Marininema halotolerans TaxID=1155944 RepID=A0A1I6RHV0_9BACL|nr:NAD-dependent epimerase/dehydratase family protein [Marininema halotolerans]SFS64160.1 dTDP-glucose 4,6-dehydratase [Marininema halotolerans]